MQGNLTDVSERLVEKAAGTEAINLVSYPSCGAKRLCSDEGDTTHRNCGANTEGKYAKSKDSTVEMLSFRHFARYMNFSKNDPIGQKTHLSNSVDVLVVMHVVQVNTLIYG